MARRWGEGRGRKFVCVTGWRVRGGKKKTQNESPFETGVELCGRLVCVVKVWTWGVFDGVLS